MVADSVDHFPVFHVYNIPVQRQNSFSYDKQTIWLYKEGANYNYMQKDDLGRILKSAPGHNLLSEGLGGHL